MKLTDKQNEIIKTLGYDNATLFLSHYPFRYETRSDKPFESWNVDDAVIFEAQILTDFKNFRYGRNQSRTTFDVRIDDEIVTVTLFNRPYLRRALFGDRCVVQGVYKGNHKVIAKTVNGQLLDAQLGIKPVYPTRQGIKQFEISRILHKILEKGTLPHTIPEHLVKKYQLMPEKKAIHEIHEPTSQESLEGAIRTLKYQEFLVYQLYGLLNATQRVSKLPKNIDMNALNAVIQNLPYTLTEDQMRSLDEVLSDLKSKAQMNRLLQGDVGSGKTIVSLLGAYAAICDGYQVAYMVPTDVLLRQHERAIRKLFPTLRVGIITQNKGEHAQELLEQIAQGSIDLIIGTHGLFQDRVQFMNLGLVIIDEQHRFGVRQREQLIQKSRAVDVLLLSATPIPRTLAASLFFDLDVSSIEHYPSHRKQTETILVHENSMRSIVDAVNVRLNKGEQVYIVCPSIDESELRKGVRNVTMIYEQMVSLFSNQRVGMLHGKMKQVEKEEIMRAFVRHEIDILVATTVIEVGVDVHNANTMIIYNAELFGLATLHQLRGRVGRGSVGGVCYVLTDSQEAIDTRLQALAETHNGFELSMQDLRNRGMGDLLGDRQSGVPGFLLGDVQRDIEVLKCTKSDAQWVVAHANDPECDSLIRHVLSTKHAQDGV